MRQRWFGLRVAYHQFRRHVEWWRHPLPWASAKVAADEWPVVVAARRSPLARAPDGAISAHTAEKTRNLTLACARINGVRLGPGEVFSFHRLVGPTTRRAGYLPALEMHDGQLQAAVGGGLCQLANLLFLLALDVDAEIVERHRHSLDLFRDVDRTVPFGCGATVFYNYVDLQFRHRLDTDLVIKARVVPPDLTAEVRARAPLPFTVHIEEREHRFYRRDGEIRRHNELWRVVDWHDGREARRELLCINDCRVLYPADDLVSEKADG
jgi:vancomycin resistance protein VanW